eukprot:7379056-Prymnesium_polylepis.1
MERVGRPGSLADSLAVGGTYKFTAFVTATRRTKHGGGTRASDVGAVMKVHAGLFPTPAEPRRGGLPCNIC